jgi:hypothetical protein
MYKQSQASTLAPASTLALANRSLKLSNSQYQQRQIASKLLSEQSRTKTGRAYSYAGYNAEQGIAISKSNGLSSAGSAMSRTQQLAGARVFADRQTAHIAWS